MNTSFALHIGMMRCRQVLRHIMGIGDEIEDGIGRRIDR